MNPEEHQKANIFYTAAVTNSFSGRSLCCELKNFLLGLKAVEKKSVQNSSYESDVMKNSRFKESI
jgi:hypothetical protein